MRDDLQILAALGIDPARLDRALEGPGRHSGYQARITPPTRRPCSRCGAPAVATCRRTIPGLGRRWQDSCRDCMVASCRL
ncbi:MULTISPECIES: hypothetical protein [Streptomyces]|uniref:Uncharacterized protein n=1 Tax=Streptomyces gibsoniae TaxID=3075529 RepID=A0ABU2U1K5_9ACTN|nr:hypothetical protein [Streptomyces sp. DSM 41699]MDT0467107.1 hypothetical protein [Streptomyces sp. DSM 41699]